MVPAQTRGFLFSDLRGYSAYTERHGDRAARELLSRYRRTVRDVIGRFGGAEVRTEGDSFYVVFDSVGQAVEAGLAVQSALAAAEGEAVRAGIGIHAGEVEDDAEQGIVSNAVNIAARICAVAEPGEVLVSDTVRSLTRSYLDVVFVPAGRRKLKGIRDPVRVYRAQSAGALDRPLARVGILRRRALFLALGLVGILGVASVVVATMVRDLGSVVDDPVGQRQASAGPLAPSATPLPPAASSAIGVMTIDLGTGEPFGYIEPLQLAEGIHTFADFRPRVTFAVEGTGWYAAVDDADAALLLLDDSSPTLGLNLVGSVAFGSVQVVFSDPCDLAESTVLDPSPNALIEWLQGHELLTTSSAKPVNIGGYSGIEVETSLSDSGCRGASSIELFPVADTRFGLVAGHKLRVIALTLPTRSLAILVEHHPEADDAAIRTHELLLTVEIDPS